MLKDVASTGLTIQGIMTWTGMGHDPIPVTINQKSINDWVKAIENGTAPSGAGIYIGVTGLDNLNAGDVVSIAPVITSKTNVQTNLDAMTKTVG